jgi:hypothetical protein
MEDPTLWSISVCATAAEPGTFRAAAGATVASANASAASTTHMTRCIAESLFGIVIKTAAPKPTTGEIR